MLPDLFNIGPIPIRSYGLTLAITFFVGIYYVQKMTARDKKPFEPYMAVCYLIILGGIVGARLSYVLLHISEFQGRWSAVVNPFASGQFGIAGLNLYGGVLLAIIGTLSYCKYKKMPVLDTFDYCAPMLAFGIGVTRIGCFLNGCCFGTPSDLPWGISFPSGSIPYSVYGDLSLHPAQLYSSLYGLALFALLHIILIKRKFAGQVVAILFMGESLFRFAIEYVRYYEDAMYLPIFGLNPTFNQFVSITLFAAGAGIYLVQLKKARSTLA